MTHREFAEKDEDFKEEGTVMELTKEEIRGIVEGGCREAAVKALDLVENYVQGQREMGENDLRSVLWYVRDLKTQFKG